MGIDVIAAGKSLLAALGRQLVSPARRLWAERAAGRSERSIDLALLRSQLQETLDRLAAFPQHEAWWHYVLQTLGHQFVTPDFLKTPSRQEWLAQADVRDDLLHLAERRALGETNEDESVLQRLAASYEARTGETAPLARGAIEVILDVMIAGLQASLRAGGGQTALAGLVQTAHSTNMEAHAATHAQLAEVAARLEPRNRGLVGARDLATAFATNTAAARVRPEIPGVGLITRPELPALASAVAAVPTLLVGRGGAGKSGLASLLVDQLQAGGQSVLLIDAGLLPASATTPTDVGASLVEPLAVIEAITTVAQGRRVTFIVDQLDTVAGTDRGNALIQLLRAARNIPNVGVLAVCRTFQADRAAEIAELGFDRFDADELTDTRAQEALVQLDLTAPPQPLLRLARNLLDLSLIASLVRRGVDVLQIAGEVELWDAYRLSIQREHPAALPRAIELAWRAAEQGSQTIAPSLVTSDEGLAALESRGVLDATATRYRFRHERIRDYLVAWDAARHPEPLAEILGRLPREALLGALRWLLALLHASDPDGERDVVNAVLGNQSLGFDVRAVVLEGLKSQIYPRPIVAAALVPHLAHPGHTSYFFDGLGPAWLAPLAASGAFANTPSAPAPYWPPLDYLKAQATEQPEEVTRVLESVQVGSPWIIGDFLEIATRLPLPLASRVADAMAAAVPKARLHIHTSRTAADLAAVLAQGGRVRSALALVQAFLEPFQAGHGPLTRRPEVGTPLDVHEARHLLRVALPALLAADSGATREVFEGLLERATVIEGDDGSTSYISRRAIEDDPETNASLGGNEGVLLVGLRDAADRWSAECPEAACDLIKRYLAHPHWLFRRVGVHLLRLNRARCGTLVEAVVGNPELLAANPAYHEMYLLLEEAFGDLSPETQAAYRDWVEREAVEAALEDYPEDRRELRRLELTRRRLWPIREYLQGPWRARLDGIVAQYGAPPLQGFLTGPYRPLVPDDTGQVEEQLRNLPLDDLIEHLRSFRPSGDPFGPHDMASAFGRITQEEPETFGTAAERFADGTLHPSLVSELLRGLRNVVHSGGSIPWRPVLAACQLVAGRTVSEAEADAAAWLDAQRDVIDLLEEGLRAETPAAIPGELDGPVRDLLVALLAHPDAGPDREQERDPLDVAINSARGRALEGLIQYAARRVHRLHLPIGQRLEPEVRAALQRHVDPVAEQSTAVHALFGFYYLTLFNLDADWVRSHESSIFPTAVTLEGYWQAAWTSYLLNTDLYGDLYTNLEPHYRRAIEALATADETEGRYLRDARTRLVQCVVLAFIEGWEDLHDASGRLALLLGVAPEELLAVAFAYLGDALEQRKVAADSDVWRRARAYWESRVAAAEMRGSPTRELAPIWRWLPGIPVLLPEVADLIERTIAHAVLGWEIDQTMGYLAGVADAYPREAARLLAAMQARAGRELRGAFHVGETERVLTAALQSGDPEAAELARAFIIHLADQGDTNFFRLLRQDQS